MTLTTSCKSAPLVEEINGLVLEYLEINGLEKTIEAFSSECKDRSIPGPFSSNHEGKTAFTHYDGENLLQAFDEGLLEKFIKLWKSFQTNVHVTSDDMKKLEVYIQVHFALYPCARGESERKQQMAMNSLKQFFEEQSTKLSHDAAILPLFALPYVSDPKNHPIFRDLFQPSWSQRLRAQLEATLAKYYHLLQQNLGTHSKLASLVLNSSLKSKEEDTKDSSSPQSSLTTIYHRDRFYQLVDTYRQTRKLLKNTRESYGKLLKISSELIIGLEASISGQKISLEPVMKRCYDIFPDLFTPADAANGESKDEPDKEYFKQLASSAQFDNIIDSDVSLFFIGISDLTPENLDYVKMKQVLRSDDSNTAEKLCLLQSLRWLLTKSTPTCRETALASFIEADILGLRSGDEDYRLILFDCMMTKNPTYLKECFARLLNTFASMKSGRAYMETNSYCVDLLVKSLHTFRGLNESYICQMVIATLQKLSLRKQMRLEMIERKVIQWLVIYLNNEFIRTESNSSSDSNKPELSKYCNPYLMEYAWALLMNLCLHEESRQYTSSIAKDIVSCVTQMLLSKPSREIYPYVISTLYSLLRNPDIFATAKKMGVQSLFANCPNVDDTEMCHHFNHVTAILQTDGFEKVQATTGEVDYDDNDDIDPTDFEPEIEVSEAWEESLKETYFTGDDLLLRKYLKPVESSADPLPTPNIRDSKGGHSKRPTGSVIVRPTTPSNSKGQSHKTFRESSGGTGKSSKLDGDTISRSSDFKVYRREGRHNQNDVAATNDNLDSSDARTDLEGSTQATPRKYGISSVKRKSSTLPPENPNPPYHTSNDIIDELALIKSLKTNNMTDLMGIDSTKLGDFKISPSSSPRRSSDRDRSHNSKSSKPKTSATRRRSIQLYD